MAGVPLEKHLNKRGKTPRAHPTVPKAGFKPGRRYSAGGKKSVRKKSS